MSTLLNTIFFFIFSALLLKDPKKWFPLVVVIFYFLLPKEACMVLGMKPNIMILLVFLGSIVYSNTLKELKTNNFYPIILFYIISSAFLSFFATGEISYFSQISFLIKKVAEMFLLGILSVAFFSHTNDFSNFARTFYIIVLIGAIYGLFSYLTLSNPYMNFMENSFRDGILSGADFFLTDSRGVIRGRISGCANHPLTWGQLHLLFIIVLPFFKKYLSKSFLIVTIVFSSLNIVLTGSRSSLIPLVLFFIGYFLIENRKHFKKILAVAVIGFLLFMVLGSIVHNEYVDTLRAYICFWDESASEKISVSGSSVSMRQEQFENAFYFIGKTNAVVGFGYGFVSNMSSDHFLREFLLGFESVALKVVVEQGILGFLFYILMFVFLCAKCITYRNNKRDKLYLCLLFICYGSSLLFTGERSTFQLFFFFLVLITREKKILCKDFLTILVSKNSVNKTEPLVEK